MKIEVGMYVRTKYGIAKIINSCFEDDNLDTVLVVDKPLEFGYVGPCDEFLCDINHVIKSSYNIIDLIEVGDYANGELIEDITGEYLQVNGESHNKFYFSKQIKSIVTKEQFEQMSYKVEV